jgi:toluene monooxygenase electron transfer component
MKITIQSRAGQVDVVGDDSNPILYSGLMAGLPLPYDCATGTCGMCKARLTSGTVETVWPEAPALAKLQRDRGDILMCQARATGDCTLRVPGEIAVSDTMLRPAHRQGKITGVRALTHDVAHIDIALSEPMNFDAGQFVVLGVPGLTGGRAYSMVNYVRAAGTLELVVKRKPGGGLSEWLFQGDRTGAALDVFGPLGRATLRPQTDGDLVMIAGGSGIAGMLSIMEHATQSGHFERHRGQVFFGVRTLADGFYLDRFDRYVARSRGALSVVLALSHEVPGPACHPSYEGILLAHGFVHDVANAQLASDCAANTCFVAGPPPMVDGAIRVLIGKGVASAAIRYDKFG